MTENSDNEFNPVIALYEAKKLEETFNKSLPEDADLARCLKNMPATWLDGICDNLGIEKASVRKDREQQIASTLLESPELREKVVGELSETARGLLNILLYKDGCCPASVFNQENTGPQGEHFCWPQYGTITPVGEMISLGLAMVGQTKLNSAAHRVVLVPSDLREPLYQALESTRPDAPPAGLVTEALATAGPAPEEDVTAETGHLQEATSEAPASDIEAALSEGKTDALPEAGETEQQNQESVLTPSMLEQPGKPIRRQKIGRNEPCPCGSGNKYKRCCGRDV